jgi:hypothetical protein
MREITRVVASESENATTLVEKTAVTRFAKVPRLPEEAVIEPPARVPLAKDDTSPAGLRPPCMPARL